MKRTYSILVIILSVNILLTSCASKQKAPRQPDENFLADISNFQLGEINCYCTGDITKPKITNFSFSISPKTNNILVKGHVGLNTVLFSLSYAERLKINESFNTYLEDIKNTKLENRKPKLKNSYTNGYTFVQWGAAGLSHEVDSTYFTNYEFITLTDKSQPYFYFLVDSAAEENSEHIYSPRLKIYLSPAQIKTIIELCSQDRIQQEVNNILSQANTFYDDEDFTEINYFSEEDEE